MIVAWRIVYGQRRRTAGSGLSLSFINWNRKQYSGSVPASPSLPEPSSSSAVPLPMMPPAETFTRRRSARKSRQLLGAGSPFGSPRTEPDTNPIMGPTSYFPDLSDCLVRHGDNLSRLDNCGPDSFPYHLERQQIDEIRSLVGGFVSALRRNQGDAQGIPRIVTMGYAEAMGEVLLERLAVGLANSAGADIFTFHARHFGAMLDGLASLWFGRPYFQPQRQPQSAAAPATFHVEDVAEDDLDLVEAEFGGAAAESQKNGNDRWLSHFLARQGVFKPKPTTASPPSASPAFSASSNATQTHARIKEQVNFHSILNHLQSALDGVGCRAPVRFIHLSGFGTSLLSPVHRAQILKFVREQEEASKQVPTRPLLVLFISESGPSSDEPASNSPDQAAAASNMPPTFANFLALKNKFRNHSEIPNTPEHDANWLVDRQTFGGLKVFVTPPRDHESRLQHNAQLQQDHRARVWSFNIRRIGDVLDQLGIKSDPTLSLGPFDQLSRAPLFLSEAIYIGYIAYDQLRSKEMPVDSAALQSAVGQFFSTRELHRSHYLQNHPSNSLKDLHTSSGQRIESSQLSKYEKRFLPCIVTPDMVRTRFEDIGSLGKVKRSLYELITLPMDCPALFQNGILKETISGILLFGPPGTGKTMLAKAVAAQSKCNFIAVNSSSIYDMYVGEGEKNVKALFRLARRLSPCIIFIDEVDALLDSRSNTLSKASRVEILNEFMAEWDGLLTNAGPSPTRVMVMAATNRPFALDDAVLRRLPRRILVDLPDSAARLQILQILLRNDRLDPGLDLNRLSGPLTESYSGSDLKNVCIAAAMGALREAMQASGGHSPPPSSLAMPPLSMVHFESALQEVPASISDSMDTIMQLRKWDQTFGEGKRLGKPGVAFGFTCT